jgi:hypothetical protein
MNKPDYRFALAKFTLLLRAMYWRQACLQLQNYKNLRKPEREI